MRPSAGSASVALHAAAIIAVFSYQASVWVSPARETRPLRVNLLAPPPGARAGGGGQRDVLPASRGRLPARTAARVFVPPTAVVNENPRLPVTQAMLISVDLPDIRADRMGSPLGVDGPMSGGRGGPSGIGDGGCCGAGNQGGPGIGGRLPGPPPAAAVKARRFMPPALIYKVEPEYSEEARKARVQGLVLLRAEVESDGTTANIHVIRPLGLGLDEKAIEAAALWRFKPATADGRAVAYTVTIEVNFRLL